MTTANKSPGAAAGNLLSRACAAASPSTWPSGAPDFFSRRRFVQAALALPAVLALPACSNETQRPALARTFFSADEYRFIQAATARLIPGDDKDPGALEAGVPVFIDRQLSGPYGRADRWYMEGPWAAGSDQQGYQLEETPAQLYRKAIAGVDAYCRERHDGKPYAELSPEDQDQVLHDLDENKIELEDFPAQAFFSVLWQNTQEGFLSDPMYGGNRDFAGWKLIGFPGPRYNYVDEITRYGDPYTMPPVGLLGRDGTRMRS
ncbi:gluconate 2-dehydrogenase subunit 3 family protein [Pusillimonas noertemannii]|uniref:Gluconate 2-dehydrogenase gamma chain n=1 Tax=Pusillimonas noertemannii TaxID=305977 RepID=A0A2U1CJZ7_9BURK|nr:gluconate 2-dehydrogenase subunit 3 family protein [Pusillimonas noertemannii]PVY61336.1 gluconate 2-dehydrogenase gamma chain [Pusillimonas noertemannii]